MRVLIAITILCFAYVNCAVVKATETNEEILKRNKEECDDTVLGGRYVDPFNCQGYYRCLMGVLTKKDCPVGLGYDPKSQECKPKVEGCSITGEQKEETKEEFMERKAEECYDFGDITLNFAFVDPFRPNWYYRCTGLVLEPYSCGEDNQYDPKLQTCVEIVKEHETKEDILKKTKKECGEKPYGGGRYVDPFDCQGYYRCVSAKLVKKDCAVGLGYDSKSQKCKPKVEGCSITGTPKEIKETKEQILERITEECFDFRIHKKRFVDPFYSNRYYVCSSGDGSLSSMPCFDQYDPKLEKCNKDYPLSL